LTGILVYYLSGFSSHGSVWTLDEFVNYCCFTFVSFLIWNGSVYASILARRPLYQLKPLYLRIPARMFITVIISWTLGYILLHGWDALLMHNRFSGNQLMLSQVIIAAMSLQVSSIYEIVYLTKERESDLVLMERTEKLKVQAQLDALKSQIDPHFIFNSLNTLSYLICENPPNAKLFNDTLAKVYRYILLNRENNLVTLQEEINFAGNYFYLLKIRFEAGLNMTLKMEGVEIDDFRIPPLSLQTLIENAIKHNYFSEKTPLEIIIRITRDNIQVSNKKQIKKYSTPSSRIGLSNLGERYQLIVHKKVLVTETPDNFTVILPIVKQQAS
ncbi:MAG TPA: histidine kinase, partial [Sediminibacterium sp.]|nr:histidine kinase [Sediminibacterium sp.]